jgi:hypothetical protein
MPFNIQTKGMVKVITLIKWMSETN